MNVFSLLSSIEARKECFDVIVNIHFSCQTIHLGSNIPIQHLTKHILDVWIQYIRLVQKTFISGMSLQSLVCCESHCLALIRLIYIQDQLEQTGYFDFSHQTHGENTQFWLFSSFIKTRKIVSNFAMASLNNVIMIRNQFSVII